MDPASRCISSIISVLGKSDYVWVIIVLVVLIMFSAYFSATETAYTSCNRIRLKNIENTVPQKAKKARKILKQLDNYDRLLSTVLVGNNIVNIAASSLATVFFVSVMNNDGLAPLISTIAITVVVLIFGEVIPKTYAKDHPEAFAMFFLKVTTVFEIIFFPLTWLLSLLKKIFKSKKESTITEDELITIVEEAENEGEIDEHESELIRSAIEFDDVDVYDVMVPRVNVEAVPDDAGMDEIAKLFHDTGYSRLPIYHETIDSIIGIIHMKDFYELYSDNKTDIRPIIQNSVCVSLNMKISAVLRMLQKAKIHLAVVVDEFGGTAGIITLEDIIEELVGEIYDEHDEVEVLVKEQSDGALVVSGSENLAELFELMGKNTDTGEEFESTTVGGFVTELLKRIPAEKEEFTYENLKFTVNKADDRKVLEVKVEKIEPPEEESDT